MSAILKFSRVAGFFQNETEAQRKSPAFVLPCHALQFQKGRGKAHHRFAAQFVPRIQSCLRGLAR